MSLITVKLVAGALAAAQQRRLARALCDAAVAIEGEAMRALTWCVIEEVPEGRWFIGAQPLRRQDIRLITGRRRSPAASTAAARRRAASQTRA